MSNQVWYTDEPVLQVGKWKILVANMYGKKYKGVKNPLLVHKCPRNTDENKWSDTMFGELPEGIPQCPHCNDPVPDEIQGLLSMYYMDARDHVWMEAGLYENEAYE